MLFSFRNMIAMIKKKCLPLLAFVTFGCFLYTTYIISIYTYRHFTKYISHPGEKALTRNTNYVINIASLPVAEAFSPLHFYGDQSLLKYQWYFRPNQTIISTLNYRFVQMPFEHCRFNTSLVIMVMSLHHMTSQRQAIRDTWGSVSDLHPWPGSNQRFAIQVFFVLGMSKNSTLNEAVAMEAATKKDMIVAQFDDSYFNLTLKALLAFKWIQEFCSHAKYVMKVDEDTYLNIPEFVTVLNSRQWKNTLFGPFFFTDPVERVGKYAVSNTSYPAPKYPPHIKGNAYLMPTEVAMKILAVSEHMPYVNMEDAEITGILAKIFNFKHFGFTKDQYYVYKAASPCELATGSKMISQKIFGDTFYQIWDRVRNHSLCSAAR